MGLPLDLALFLQQLLSAKRIGQFLRTTDIQYFSESSIAGEAVPQTDSLYVIGSVTWAIPQEANNEAAASIFGLYDLDLHFPEGQMTLVAGKFGSGKTLLLLAMLGEARLLEGKISYAVSPLLDPGHVDDKEWRLAKNGVAYVPQASLITHIMASHTD